MDLDSALLDPSDPARRFEAMARLRREDPVHRMRPASGQTRGPLYLASRAAVAEALPRIDCFGGGVGAADVPPDLQALNGVAEPRHGRIRRIVNGLIAPHRAAEVKPFLERLCAERLDAIDRRGPAPVDAMAEYIDHVPASAICWLTGWDPADAIKLYRWTVEVCEKAMDMKPGNSGTIAEMVPAFGDYVEQRVTERLALDHAAWPDDGMTRLLTTEVEGERLSPTAVKTQLLFLLGAGSETSRDMLGLLLHQLASDPALYARLRADRTLIANATLEALRLCSPTQFMVRRCEQATEIVGHPVEVGENVYIGLASANRDEAVWEDSSRFRIDRPNASDHLAFGSGPHVCPGSFLVRLEARVAIGALLDRYARIEPVAAGAFEPLRTPMFYGPAALPLRFHRD